MCLGHNVHTVFGALLGATVGSLPSLLWPASSLEPHLLLQGEFLETHRPAPNTTFTQAAFMAGRRVEVSSTRSLRVSETGVPVITCA